MPEQEMAIGKQAKRTECDTVQRRSNIKMLWVSLPDLLRICATTFRHVPERIGERVSATYLARRPCNRGLPIAQSRQIVLTAAEIEDVGEWRRLMIGSTTFQGTIPWDGESALDQMQPTGLMTECGVRGFKNPPNKEETMISEVMWIWVGVVSLWVVMSIARRISNDHRNTPTIVDRSV
jgi:hypothetical protein